MERAFLHDLHKVNQRMQEYDNKNSSHAKRVVSELVDERMVLYNNVAKEFK